MKGTVSEFKVLIGHVDSPGELLPLRLVVDLLDGHAELLAPVQATRQQWGCAAHPALLPPQRSSPLRVQHLSPMQTP